MSEMLQLHNMAVPVPDGFHELVSRRNELIKTQGPRELLAPLWADLGDGFARIGYRHNAQLCLDRAAHYGWRPAEAPP